MTKSNNPEEQSSPAVAAGNGAENSTAGSRATSTLFNPIKVNNQTELNAALDAGEQYVEIHGEWEDLVVRQGAALARLAIYGTVTGSVDIYGTVTGSVYIDGTVTGSVYIYGTAKVGSVYIYGTAKVGSVDIYGTAKVGSVYIDGTVTGSVDIYGTVTGSVDIYGTVTGSVDIYGTVTETNPAKKYFGATLEAIQADFNLVLAAAFPPEIDFLRAAMVAGRINGHLYHGECACLVGTLEKARKGPVIARNNDRLAEKWFMPISKGHTPENSTHAKKAVEWIDAFLAEKKSEAASVTPAS